MRVALACLGALAPCRPLRRQLAWGAPWRWLLSAALPRLRGPAPASLPCRPRSTGFRVPRPEIVKELQELPRGRMPIKAVHRRSLAMIAAMHMEALA